MLKRVTLLLIMLSFASQLMAQSKVSMEVSVEVTDKGKGTPLEFAYINIYTDITSDTAHKLLFSVQADENGLATLQIRDFPVAVEILASGFETEQLRLLTPPPGTLKVGLTKKFSTLDEVVVTGLATPTKLKDALSTYQVVSKAAMQAQGAVTVNDALKNQLNINIGVDNMLGSKTSMQGLKGDKIKILIDGIPLNGREMGEIDLGQINLNNVEKIEIVQGPMSVVYGTDALGGVINIVTKKNNIPWQLQAGTYYESIGKYNFDASATYSINKQNQFNLSGGRNYFQGWKPLDPLERSFLWKPKEQYFGNFSYNYTAKSAFRLQFAVDFVKEKITNKDSNYTITPFYATATDEYYRNTRMLTRLNMSGKLGKNGTWQSQNGYSYYHRTRNRYIKDMVSLNQELDQSKGVQDTTTFQDFTFRGTYANAINKLKYNIGYDINLQNGKSGKISPEPKQQNDYAAFANVSIPLINDKLTLQPALRYAYNTVYQAPLIPSFNMLYNAVEDIQLRFSYAKGFRAPSLKELYLHFYDINHEVEGNPNLKAEQGEHLQFSASWTVHKKQSDFAKLLFTAYYNNVYNQISIYQPDPSRALYATYTNIDRMRNVIGTLQADQQWKNLYAQVGYSVIHMLNSDSATYATAHQATATVQYSWPKVGINFATFYKYFGKQARLVPTIDGGASYNGILSPYSFWDASVEKKFWNKRIQLIVGVKNILNIQTSNVAGAQAGGVHSGGASNADNIATGRSLFTTLRLNLQ